ncbi:MAG: tetratricopeptide repeat protein [Spirochaetota bacterium]
MTPRHFLKTLIITLLFLSATGKLYAGYYDEGCKFFSYKNYEKARDMFLKSIEASDDGNSYYFMGEIEKIEGNYDKAEEYYKLAVTKYMNAKYKKLAYWNIIVLKEQKGKYNEMVIACRELWDAMRDDGAKKKVEALINKFLWTDNDEAKSLYNSGAEYKKKNVHDKAREAFYNAQRIDSAFLAPKFELGLMFYNEKNASQAIDYFNDIIDKIPFYGEVHLLLGDIYFNKQSYRNAIDHLSKAGEYGFFDNKTKYSLVFKIGTSYYETGDFEKAQEEFIFASELNKKALDPLLFLSAIYIKKNNYEQAISVLLKAKELNQNNPEIIFQIGSIYYKMNDQKYTQYFSQLLNKYFQSKETIPQKYLKAFTLLLKNNYDNKKYDDASKIIEILPESQKSGDINLMSAKSYHYTGKHEKAIEYFEKLSLGNDDRYLLCISYARSGSAVKAKELLLSLSNINGYFEKSKSDAAIKKIAYEIENDRLRKEEERKAEEKRRSDEEKRKEEKIIEDKLIEEKLKEEKIKAEKEKLNAPREENNNTLPAQVNNPVNPQ